MFFGGTRVRVHFCLWHCNDGGLGTLKFAVNSPCVPLLLFWSALMQLGLRLNTLTDTSRICMRLQVQTSLISWTAGTVNRSSSMTPTALRTVQDPMDSLAL